MLFVETSLFTKIIGKYLNDDEYSILQNFLHINPEFGDLVKGSGGVRELRWSAKGRGKRGGLRVMYYFKKSENEIWMLTVYGKNEKSTIPGHVLKRITEELKNG